MWNPDVSYDSTVMLRAIFVPLPGMMYVSDRRAVSICDTAPAFLVINSPYTFSHFGASDRTSGI